MSVTAAERVLAPEAIDRRARALGRELFERIGRGPAPWHRAWWDDRLMAVSMGDPRVKVQLFRFIDALPALRADESVRAHLAAYLAEAGDAVPGWLDLALRAAPPGSPQAGALAWAARTGATHMAHRFIAGATPDEALRSVLRLRRRRLAFTADLLGEAVISEAEAEAYQQTCLDLLRTLAPALDRTAEVPQVDRDHLGPIPRANLSLKLTSLAARFDPIHAEATARVVLGRLRPILHAARDLGAFVNVDMEQYAYKGLTHAIFREVLDEPEFRDWPHAGIVVQAYLRDAEDDLRALADWARARGTPVTVRLVKGAYWDYEVVHARQNDWPVPVYTEKWRSDACYERCTRFLLENHEWLRPALGSHNVRSLAHGLAAAEAIGLPEDSYEMQVLYGMGEPIAEALAAMGRRVRVYTPYGAMLPGMAYLVRRLLENTSNESFLKASFSDRVGVDDLLRDPEETGAMWARTRRASAKPVASSGPLPPFRNEPLTDFTRPEARDAMREALATVVRKLGPDLPLRIGGRDVRTADRLESTDPGQTSRVVARTSRARAEHADAALAAAREAQPAWGATPAAVRAAVLVRAAEILRRRRFELAAWEVYECAKPWREADADIAEAVDFCEFYAREMIRLAEPDHRDVPGETNAVERIPRGVAVVIPPWNFPLAIPMGMTVAALVAGNAVVLKPAEQSPAMAWHLVEVLREAGLPEGVLSFLPGIGEEVGAALVADPRVDLIAFTGSKAVGLEINRKAAETPVGQDHVKRVIAEMGGKNAIIVDDDADLDEAVVGVLQSAFGYSGQKCSACSRAIVLDAVYDGFLARLVEAGRAVTVGPAEDPETVVGPVIDADAAKRVRRYSDLGSSEGRVVLRLDPDPALASRGNYVPTTIVADVAPDARLAQEEIFGPVLAVIRARDLGHAIAIANGTPYRLTGGIYSRHPENIARARREVRVGNFYINRTITGALVDRQPFGGFGMSGIGTKAGGRDYLLEFLLPRTVTENTLRRGFAPDAEDPVSGAAVEAASGI